MNQFKINDYLILKLQENKTQIYVGAKKFRQCKFILLNIPISKITLVEEIKSIDEAAERLDATLERDDQIKNYIEPETEFWAHCSNLQVWYEHDYDTRLLHRNLAFPLLEALTKAGDPIAKKGFKEEIASRLSIGNETVTEYLISEGYDRYLNHEEQIISTLNAKESETIFTFEEFTSNLFIQVPKLGSYIYNINEDPIQQIVVRNRSVIGLLVYWFEKPLRILPEEMGCFKNLEEFRYYGTNINSLPKSIGNLNKLKYVALNSESLKEVTKPITELYHLENLIVRSSKLETVSEKIGDLKDLKILSVGNKLITLPESIAKLKKLEYLYLNHNKFLNLPEYVYSLKNLKELNVKSNLIEDISESISGLKNLQILDIRRNKIETLPESLINLKKLRTLLVDDAIKEKNKDLLKKLEFNGIDIF